MSSDSPPDPSESRATGLCARCAHLRAQSTRRGAVFYRCARADEDARYPRYPPLPILRCAGFEERGGFGEGERFGEDEAD